LSAVLAEKTVPLGDLLNWKPGTRIMFNTRPQDRVELRCGDFPMYKASTGQKQGVLAVRIDHYIPPQKKND
jgi:flagellar motor switch protein FliM